MRATISRRPVVLAAVSLASGLAALALGSAAARSAARAARSDYVAIPVAARAISEGSELTSEDVRTVAVPPAALPPEPARAPVGRTLTIPVLPGDPILEGKLAPSGRGISALLEPGQVAATVIPAAPVAVNVGERVRITATFDPQRYSGPNLVRVVAPAALVLSRGDPDGRLVVAVSPVERDHLALAQATARLDVAVLAPGS